MLDLPSIISSKMQVYYILLYKFRIFSRSKVRSTESSSSNVFSPVALLTQEATLHRHTTYMLILPPLRSLSIHLLLACHMIEISLCISAI